MHARTANHRPIFARARRVRAFVWLLALALVVAGQLAVAAPLAATMTTSHATGGSDGGCGHRPDGPATPAPHTPHGCCHTTCACAFVHAVGDVAAPAPAVALHGVPRPVGAWPGRVRVQPIAPLLRPPIA